MVFTTSCGPKKHKIDDSTVLPFKDKAELDKLLDLPILPEYTIEEYYTKTDFLNGDELFVVCCKFMKEVSPAEVQKIVEQVDSQQYAQWYTDEWRDKAYLNFYLDTTLTADRKMPDILGNRIHVSIEMPCRKKDSWKGFEVVFRNNRADFSVIVDRDTLSKVLGVEFPPLTEKERIDETIYFEFDTIPSEEFYQALEKAPHWSVSHHGDMTFYNYEYDDGEVWTTVDVIKGETHFSFDRRKSMGIGNNGSTIDEIGKRLSNFRDKKLKSESK
jgi:hypothetical protein